MEQETTQKRGRGRPRKNTENNPVAQVQEQVISVALEEIRAMQEQNARQMELFMKMAEKLGLQDPPRPPSEDTVILEHTDDTSAAVVDEFARPSGKLPPGSLLGDPKKDPSVGWVPWRKDDLNPNDKVTFVPAPVPSLVFPMTDDEGRQKIRLDVNDLVCWLTVGIPNTVNKFFYDPYNDAYQTWRELENFKRKGPSIAPWGQMGPDGRPSWYYDPMTLSFGMDEDGHALTPFRSNPLRTYQQAEPESI